MINSIFDWLSFKLPYTGRKQYEKLIKNNLRNVKTVLHVGCGPGVFQVYRDYETTGIHIYDQDDLKKAKENDNYKTLIRTRHEAIIPDLSMLLPVLSLLNI